MEPNRVAFVTTHFHQLQGLRLIPLGLFLLIVAAMSLGWLDWLPGRPPTRPGSWGNAWLPAFFATALAASIACGDVYRNRYGGIDPLARSRRNAGIAVGVGLFVVAAVIDLTVGLPVLLCGLVVAASLFTVGRVDGRVRRHYALTAVLWVFLSLLPTFGTAGDMVARAVCAGGGMTLIICGMGDHRTLTKTMTRIA